MIKMICDKCNREVDQIVSGNISDVLSRDTMIECRCHGETDTIEVYRYQIEEGKPIKVFDPSGLIYRNIFEPTFKKTEDSSNLEYFSNGTINTIDARHLRMVGDIKDIIEYDY